MILGKWIENQRISDTRDKNKFYQYNTLANIFLSCLQLFYDSISWALFSIYLTSFIPIWIIAACKDISITQHYMDKGSKEVIVWLARASSVQYLLQGILWMSNALMEVCLFYFSLKDKCFIRCLFNDVTLWLKERTPSHGVLWNSFSCREVLAHFCI